MLVLARKEGETLELSHGITVRVVRIKGNAVRIGIEADRSIKVKRGELKDGPRDSGDVAVDAGNGD